MTNRLKVAVGAGRKLRHKLPVYAAVFFIAGCTGTTQDPASMLDTRDYGRDTEIGSGPLVQDAASIELIQVTAETIDRYAVAPRSQAGSVYRLGTGDVLQIFVVDEPELTLSAGYRVAADGAISVPYLGSVVVSERSVEEVRADLVRRLSRYRRSPQVDVRVLNFNARHIAVVGEVRQPNRQPLTDQPLTAIDAINAAGGFSEDPSQAHVVLIRNGVEQGVDIQSFLTRGQAMPALMDGDVLRVGGSRAALHRTAPQEVLFHRGGRRVDRISLGSGAVRLSQVVAANQPLPGASVFVLRGTSARTQVLQLSAVDASSPQMGGRFQLQSGDLVTIEANPSIVPNELVAQLAPALRLRNRH